MVHQAAVAVEPLHGKDVLARCDYQDGVTLWVGRKFGDVMKEMLAGAGQFLTEERIFLRPFSPERY